MTYFTISFCRILHFITFGSIEAAAADVTKQEIERPKRGMKIGIQESQNIIQKKADYRKTLKQKKYQQQLKTKAKHTVLRCFKEQKIYINEDIELSADRGFQGILSFHKNSLSHMKKSKDRLLTGESKAYSRKLSKRRIAIENINRRIKRSDIFSDI